MNALAMLLQKTLEKQLFSVSTMDIRLKRMRCGFRLRATHSERDGLRSSQNKTPWFIACVLVANVMNQVCAITSWCAME